MTEAVKSEKLITEHITADSGPGSVFRVAAHRAESLFVLVAFFVLARRLFGLISQYAVNVFFGDQWDFNEATLFQRHSLWRMFDWQFGPHRQGAGALFQRLVEPSIHWNSRTESFIVGGLLVFATASALWLKTHLFGSLSYTDAIIPLVFLNPLQFETLFIVTNFAHGPMPVLLILLYCVAWTCKHPVLRYGLVLTVNFLTIYTGFGLLLGPVTLVILAVDYWVNLRRQPIRRAYSVAPLLIAAASLGSFFIGYRPGQSAPCVNLQPVGSYIEYAMFMLSPFFGAQVGALAVVAGMLALCGLVLAMVVTARGVLRRDNPQWTRDSVTAVLIGYCLLFCFTTAYGRICLGLELAQSSRYVIYMNLGFLGLYFFLLRLRDKTIRNLLVLVYGISLLGTIVSGERSRPQMAYWHDRKLAWKECYLSLGNIATCDEAGWVHPGPSEATHLQEKLDFLKTARQNLFAGAQ